MTSFDPKKFPQSGWFTNSKDRIVNVADTLGLQGDAFSPFNEMLAVQRTQIFSLSAVYPLSKLRDVITGTVTHEISEYRITPGSVLESAEIIRYVPGFPAEMGIGVRSSDAGVDFKYGPFDDQNGFYWHRQGGDFSVGVRSGGVDTRVIDRSKWNIDKLDGTGVSGLNIGDGTDGIIFQVTYTYYGYGAVVYWVQDNRSGFGPRMWIAHIECEFADGTSTENSNLPIRIENNSATEDVFCAGRQASIIGQFTPNTRPTTVVVPTTAVTTDWTFLVGAQRQPGNPQISFTTEELIIINEGTEPVIACFVLADSLTGAAWGLTPELRSATETFIQFDNAATDIVNPEAISDMIYIPGSNRGSAPAPVDGDSRIVRIPRDLIAGAMVRTLSGTTDVSAIVSMSEEW